MPTPTHIDAAGINFPIVREYNGPICLPRMAANDLTDPLAWVVQEWVRGDLPELLDEIERGVEGGGPGYYAVPISNDELTPELREAWRSFSGQETIEDPIVAGSLYTRGAFAIPRAVLIAMMREMGKLRDEWAHNPPPWEPAAPIAVPEPAPSPNLFCAEPTELPPLEYERDALLVVEERARTLESAEAVAATEDERADVVWQRRNLLEDLAAYGVLDERRVADKRAFLEQWQLSTLASYLAAAVALRTYQDGSIRASYELDPAANDLLEGNVSLDWFRKPVATPADATPDGWLAFCEQVLLENNPDGEGGVILSKVGKRRYEIRWRVEARFRPVVVSAVER